MKQRLKFVGILAELIDDLDERIRHETNFKLDDMTPVPAAESVMMPTFPY